MRINSVLRAALQRVKGVVVKGRKVLEKIARRWKEVPRGLVNIGRHDGESVLEAGQDWI
jgi:hypothetical protein